AGTAPAQADDDPYCSGTSYGDEPGRAVPLRMGVDPEPAGSVGTGQSSAVPLDEAKDVAALAALVPLSKAFVLRVNRLFWADGAYAGATDALIQGIEAARDEADALGRTDMRFGFTFAYRWNPGSDAKFWTTLADGGEAFRRALGFVGIDDYPGGFWPPIIAPN